MSVSPSRQFWLELMLKISRPILLPLSRGQLRETLVVECSPTFDKRPKEVAYLEAFGRLLSGVAPFLAASGLSAEEESIRSRMERTVLRCLEMAVDPSSPDFMLWYSEDSRQPLVDAAYLVQGFFSAPLLWSKLPRRVKVSYVDVLQKLKHVKPHNNNWVLFPAMIETFLRSVAESTDSHLITEAVRKVNGWYVGDGWYKDGPAFHFDNYNGFDIHPMLTQVIDLNTDLFDDSIRDTATKRMQRYSHHLERYISPEGYYPVFGRSSTYRTAAFWPLTKLVLAERLPPELKPAQVRCALTAVLGQLFKDTAFTDQGALTLGFTSNEQQVMADHYSNTGSMYIASLVFLPLGLPPTSRFWSDPDLPWTQCKAWGGEPFRRDSPRV